MLAKLSLHPPTNGLLCLGATISGTVDFRESQQAAADDPALPKCVQVAGTRNVFCSDASAVSEISGVLRQGYCLRACHSIEPDHSALIVCRICELLVFLLPSPSVWGDSRTLPDYSLTPSPVTDYVPSQMMVLLETEERVDARWAVASKQLASSGIRQVNSLHTLL